MLETIDVFYAEVMQNLKAWAPVPPRMRVEASPGDAAGEQTPVALVSTALSSQDGVEIGPVSAMPGIGDDAHSEELDENLAGFDAEPGPTTSD